MMAISYLRFGAEVVGWAAVGIILIYLIATRLLGFKIERLLINKFFGGKEKPAENVILRGAWPEALFFSRHVPSWEFNLDKLDVLSVDISEAIERGFPGRERGELTIWKNQETVDFEIKAAGVIINLRKWNPMHRG